MAFLLQKYRRLVDDAELAWHAGDENEGAKLDAEAHNVYEENKRRLEAATAKFYSFSEECRDSGWLNAGQTYKALCERPNALAYCELWELAAASCRDLVECGTFAN